ncbi:MAG TPA: VapC toxin family PIN domain ribonuclease [Bacteroidetes bacterium]|nr:VapC toxin family PIN domain ribonuclease [Bacteroidota bacterium]
MSRFFLDTNIFVYNHDSRDPNKRMIATKLIESALDNQSGVISSQVIQEFINIATRKFEVKFKPDDLQDYIQSILYHLWEVLPTQSLFDEALYISERYKYSFYDSLIIAAALTSGCDTLYSEDLQHGQKIQNLQIINPFLT